MQFKNYNSVKALIEFENKFLILKGNDFENGEYEIPGGRKEEGETNEQTLLREVKEETGLNIEIIKPLNKWNMIVTKKNIKVHGETYYCKAYSNKITLSSEYQDYKWVTKEELISLSIPIWAKEAINLL